MVWDAELVGKFSIEAIIFRSMKAKGLLKYGKNILFYNANYKFFSNSPNDNSIENFIYIEY